MKVLSIGNSFSDDAHRYLHKISRIADHENEIYTWNLMIGGCPLSKHHDCMKNDLEEYWLFVNGENTNTRITLKKALAALEWDIITFQQVSRESFKYETYTPYLAELIAYAKETRPNAKIFLHETWAYAEKSGSLSKMNYENHDEMYADVKKVYSQAAKEHDIDALIPAGRTMQLLYKQMDKIHRDDIHANDIARFAIALTWYQMLTEKDISKADFSHLDFDERHTRKEIKIAKKVSLSAIKDTAYRR